MAEPDLATLKGWREKLKEARYSGVRSVNYDGRSVNYSSDAEMKAALVALNQDIEAAEATAVPRQVRTFGAKGV